jgi:hypothetical protein
MSYESPHASVIAIMLRAGILSLSKEEEVKEGTLEQLDEYEPL